MPDLGIDTIAFAAARREDYVPLASLPGAAGLVPPERLAAAGIPRSRLMVRIPEDDDVDVAAQVLAALGPPAAPQPLFFVRSGPLRDPNVAALAGLVHRSGWAGEDVGLSHLDELGGTTVFGLLEWAVDREATAVLCDEPLFADEAAGPPRFAAVGFRLRRGSAAPLTVSGCGEGKPAFAGDHRFTGRGPCDAWLSFCAALAEGVVADGERVLLHTRGPLHEGWLALLATDVAALRLAPAAPVATASLLGGAEWMRIGVDLMSIPRFAEVAVHPRYRTLVFTPVELEQAARMGAERSLERLAGRFSVKEATCKMLGRGFGQGLRWRDIEVTNDDWGAPLVTLGGGAAEIAEEAGLEEIVVTLSHQADLVVAVAAAGCARPPRPFRRAATPSVAVVPARFDELAALAADLFSVPAGEVTAAASFAGDLGVTSVVVIELLARIERRYGVRIPEAGIYRMTDLRRTYGVVAEAAGW